MEEALIQRLLASAAVTGVFGQRIHMQLRPDNEALPALTITVVSDRRDYTMEAPDELQEARIQFDSRALTYLDAKLGLRAVLSEMEKAQTKNGIEFSEGLKVYGSDMPMETLGGGTSVFRITMDIMVFFRQIA